jgi:RNA polymerase sigma-70 factor, ECF subfamily
LSETTQLEERAVGLVRRAQAGEQAACEELLTYCHGTIRRWAGVLAEDADEAEDVAQEVMIRIAQRLHRYGGRSRFTTWLYQVTRHTALSLRRRVARRLRLLGELPGGAEPQRGGDPVAAAEASQVRRVVAELFRELPRRQREVFYLVDIEGHDAVDIAPRLGLRPVTVRAHLFRARRALRSKILERHPEVAADFRGDA